MKIRKLCGGPMWPWRYGWLKPRKNHGAVVIDNLGLAFIYWDPKGLWL